MPLITLKNVFEACDICNPVLVVWMWFENFLEMKSETLVQHLKNLTNWEIGSESRSITTLQGEIDERKSEVIAFVVNIGMNITANNFFV